MTFLSDPAKSEAVGTMSWTPPEGMSKTVASEWRSFYRGILVRYGVTPEHYLDLYVAQKGRCAICRVATGKHPQDPKGRGGRRLGVDHNHVTGQVRGLLCTGGDKTCNRIIGWLPAPALKRAAAYLTGERTPGVIYETNGRNREVTEYMLWMDDPSVPVVKP